MNKKILLIEDQQQCFDYYKAMLEENHEYEIVNKTPVFDSSDVAYRTREEQKVIIEKLISDYEKKFDVILCDLCLRDEEDVYSLARMKSCLSIAIYCDKKDELDKKGKKFVFVTTRKEWEERNFYKIEGIQKDDKHLRCMRDNANFCSCPYVDEQGKPLCGEKFDSCTTNRCFNKRLRRIIND